MSSQKDFHVSIIGGGIGGISAAIGLRKAGIAVDLFESAEKYGEIGAGISFGKNACTAIKQLGLDESFQKQVTIIPSGIWFEWREGEGEKQDLIATTISKPLGNSSVHRAKFLDSMVHHLDKSMSHFGKKLNKIQHLDSNDDKLIRLHFQDGSTFDTDVVIGYDGIHSTVREHVLGRQAKLEWSGSWAYRGLIPTKEFIESVGKEKGEYYAKTPQMFLGKDTHVLIFPIDHYETVNLVAFSTDRSTKPDRPIFPKDQPWTQPTTLEHMISQFPGWGKDIISMFKCMKNPSKWALHQIIPTLETYVNKTVCIAGDAAHGGTPHQGALAGQAMEDAVFLSWLLSQDGVKRDNLVKVLSVYDSVRRPRANEVLETSLLAGDLYEFASPLGDDRAKVKEDLEGRMEWIWGYDPNVEFEKGKKELQALNIM